MSIILGHRGLGKGRDENTLLSLIRAIQLGADGVEIDARLTKDNVIVLSHDPDLNRTLGLDIEVKETTYREFKEEDLIHEERLALLEQVYLELPDNAIINVELKDPEVAEFVVPLVNSFDALDRTIFSSFVHDCLLTIRNSDPKARIGLLFSEHDDAPGFENRVMERIEKIKPYSVHLPIAYLNKLGKKKATEFLNTIRKSKTATALWTLNDAELFKSFQNLCDFIITDRAEEFSSIRTN